MNRAMFLWAEVMPLCPEDVKDTPERLKTSAEQHGSNGWGQTTPHHDLTCSPSITCSPPWKTSVSPLQDWAEDSSCLSASDNFIPLCLFCFTSGVTENKQQMSLKFFFELLPITILRTPCWTLLKLPPTEICFQKRLSGLCSWDTS